MKDEFSPDMSKTYIYQGEEYILTGRRAEKEIDVEVAPRRIRKSSRRARKENVPDIMVEIRPATRTSVRGAVVSPSITKELQWVKMSELYAITDKIADDYWEAEDDESTDSSS